MKQSFSFRIEERVLKHIEKIHAFSADATLIVGFSGGADSTALLKILSNLRGYNLRLVAAHLDHSLRGSESDGDLSFCREFAADMGVLFESKTLDIRRLASESSTNIEEVARYERYRFFSEMRCKYAADAIVIAHHADDQAETVLMRLLRGSGTLGLAGIRPVNSAGIVRPLLPLRKSEIVNYLEENEIAWREDSSNTDTALLRNRIRHELLPLLRSYNSSIDNALNNMAELLAMDNEALDTVVRGMLADKMTWVLIDTLSLPISVINDTPASLRFRVIRMFLAEFYAPSRNFSSFEHIAAIEKMLNAEAPNLSCKLPGGIKVHKEYDSLIICRDKPEEPILDEKIISGYGNYPLWRAASLNIAPSLDSHDKNAVVVNRAAAPFPWLARTFRNGDRIRSSNGKMKKLKELFIEKRIPPRLRNRLPLIINANGEIFHIPTVWTAFWTVPDGNEILNTEIRFEMGEI